MSPYKLPKNKNDEIVTIHVNFARTQLENMPKLNYCPGISRYYGAPELLNALKCYQ